MSDVATTEATPAFKGQTRKGQREIKGTEKGKRSRTRERPGSQWGGFPEARMAASQIFVT